MAINTDTITITDTNINNATTFTSTNAITTTFDNNITYTITYDPYWSYPSASTTIQYDTHSYKQPIVPYEAKVKPPITYEGEKNIKQEKEIERQNKELSLLRKMLIGKIAN